MVLEEVEEAIHNETQIVPLAHLNLVLGVSLVGYESMLRVPLADPLFLQVLRIH